LPAIAQESLIVAQEASSGWTTLDTIQVGLDIAGYIPVIGIVADLTNAGIHLVRGNYVDAGLSAIGAIPGFGDAIKGGAKIAKAAGGVAGVVGQGAKQGSNAVKAGGEVAGGAQKTLNKNIGDCKLAPNGSGGACFTEGTQIVVGVEYDENDVFVQYITVNIEDIKVGDYVYSYDTLTGEVSYKEVTATFIRESDHINYLTITDEHGNEQVFETTDAHPFWVVTDEPDLERAARSVVDENGVWLYHDNIGPTEHGFWVEAKDLHVGDVFLGANGELSTLVAMERVVFSDGIKVYNFTVVGNHNYFVIAKDDPFGQTCILVHNATNDYPLETDVKKFMRESKLNGKWDSENNLRLFNNKDNTVQEFMGEFLKGLVKRKMPASALNMTVGEALKKGKVDDVNVRKLLNNFREKFRK